MLPAPATSATSTNVEATKTEPDKNTYLVLQGQNGPDAELRLRHALRVPGPRARRRPASSPRINLDADGTHRVTLMATQGHGRRRRCPTIDGSTWDPFASGCCFTTENSAPRRRTRPRCDYPSRVEDTCGVFGRGGYEGVQTDSAGNIWLVEDAGGASRHRNPNAKQPNSFVYRFTPSDPANLRPAASSRRCR